MTAVRQRESNRLEGTSLLGPCETGGRPQAEQRRLLVPEAARVQHERVVVEGLERPIEEDRVRLAGDGRAEQARVQPRDSAPEVSSEQRAGGNLRQRPHL